LKTKVAKQTLNILNKRIIKPFKGGFATPRGFGA
jgi:hypothetical protein